MILSRRACVQTMWVCMYRVEALHVALPMQTWDVNKAAPESLGGPFDLILASNAVHTCDNMAGECDGLLSLALGFQQHTPPLCRSQCSAAHASMAAPRGMHARAVPDRPHAALARCTRMTRR